LASQRPGGAEGAGEGRGRVEEGGKEGWGKGGKRGVFAEQRRRNYAFLQHPPKKI